MVFCDLSKAFDRVWHKGQPYFQTTPVRYKRWFNKLDYRLNREWLYNHAIPTCKCILAGHHKDLSLDHYLSNIILFLMHNISYKHDENRESLISPHVPLNLLHEFGYSDKIRDLLNIELPRVYFIAKY